MSNRGRHGIGDVNRPGPAKGGVEVIRVRERAAQAEPRKQLGRPAARLPSQARVVVEEKRAPKGDERKHGRNAIEASEGSQRIDPRSEDFVSVSGVQGTRAQK